MANVLINEDTMTDIADAIRSKKGVSTTYKPSDMPSAIESISGGGVTPTGTINITANGTHDVTNYASANVAVPQGTTPTGTKEISITTNGTTTEDVSAYANAQITVNVPSGGSGYSLNDLATNAEPSGVLNISVPVGDYAFHSKTNITKVTGSATTIGNYAFEDCTGIAEIDLPNCTNIYQYAFRNCTNLETLKLPNLLGISGTGFRGCSKLSVIVLPKITGFAANVFYSCTLLEAADFFAPAQIASNMFTNCSALNKLILRNTESVSALQNINAFNGTPFANGGAGGTLYVPQALISSYQSASNWSTLLGYANNSIQAIENSIYETQYADGTPISA